MAPAGAAGPDALAAAVAPFADDLARSVLLFDFDGTLSPTVDDPDQAVPAPGVVDLSARLAAVAATVGVVSGRPVSFLAHTLPAALVLSGQYGMETIVAGEHQPRPEFDRWRPAMAAAVADAQALATSGMRVEPKGLTATIHYRGRPELAAEVAALAAGIAAAHGLSHRAAKMSVELVPPTISTKADEVRRWSEGAARVLYAGDDLGDVPAFEELAALRSRGRHTLSVAVDNEELPPEVRAVVDLTVPGTEGMVDLLRALLG